jgi:type II secretion system protein H
MKNKGFSLVEIIVVLVIMSLSIALVTPSFSRFLRTVELKGAAKKVGGILRYSRSEAINKGRTVQVLFNSNLREIRVQSKGLLETKEEQEEMETPIPERIYSLPDGIRIKKVDVLSTQSTSDIPFIEFYPNGGSNGGSIFLDSEDRNIFNIEVHFLTGMVKVIKAEGR